MRRGTGDARTRRGDAYEAEVVKCMAVMESLKRSTLGEGVRGGGAQHRRRAAAVDGGAAATADGRYSGGWGDGHPTGPGGSAGHLLSATPNAARGGAPSATTLARVARMTLRRRARVPAARAHAAAAAAAARRETRARRDEPSNDVEDLALERQTRASGGPNTAPPDVAPPRRLRRASVSGLRASLRGAVVRPGQGRAEMSASAWSRAGAAPRPSGGGLAVNDDSAVRGDARSHPPAHDQRPRARWRTRTTTSWTRVSGCTA